MAPDGPHDLLSLVTARADGNPFFVPELVNTLVDDGVLACEGDTWVLTTRLEEVTVPPTIPGLIAACIDNLAPVSGQLIGADRSSAASSCTGSCSPSPVRPTTSRTASPDCPPQISSASARTTLISSTSSSTRSPRRSRTTGSCAVIASCSTNASARGIEAQLGDRAGEFVETLAYHYQRSGHVVEAVGYLRRSGRKALDRYTLAEAHRQYRAAYDLLTADDDDTNAVDAATRDRLLIETIIEWAQCHYYTCDMVGLRDLQERHRDLPAAVGDDVLTARWTAWVGMVTWQEGRISDADRLLTEALELGRHCDDATAQAYALAWLTWVATQAGDTARAVEIWPVLSPLVLEVADPHDRQYVQIKGLCGVGQASARRGDTKSATAYASELLEIGRRTGNRRASAMGHMVLVVVGFVRGDEYAAKAATRAAIDCDADPMYMVFAEAWAAGLAMGSSSPRRRAAASIRSIIGGGTWAGTSSVAPWLSSATSSTCWRDTQPRDGWAHRGTAAAGGARAPRERPRHRHLHGDHAGPPRDRLRGGTRVARRAP